MFISFQALLYEGERLFKDKLVTDADKTKYDEIITEQCSIKYNDVINKINLNGTNLINMTIIVASIMFLPLINLDLIFSEVCFVWGENKKLQKISVEDWERCIQRAMAQLGKLSWKLFENELKSFHLSFFK